MSSDRTYDIFLSYPRADRIQTMAETMRAPYSPPRIFISYSRNDGAEFARNLRRRLIEECGFAAWHDRTEMQVDEVWWQQIVAALTNEYVGDDACCKGLKDGTQGMAACMAGRRLCAAIASPNLNFKILPHWMRSVHFTEPDTGEAWTRFIHTLEGPCQEKHVTLMAWAPPEDFVELPSEFNELVTSLPDCEREAAIAITATLHRASGYGKTTLAKAFCHDERILDAFYDGILWATIGKTPIDIAWGVKDLIDILSGERSGFAGLDAASSHLLGLLADRHILIVIDDIWNGAHLTPFVRGYFGCRKVGYYIGVGK